MAKDNVGSGMGVIVVLSFMCFAIPAYVAFAVTLGLFVGMGVGFTNYCKALYANVGLERPAAS